MHAQHILEGLLEEATPTMHAVRREALTAAVASTLNGATLSVTALGRGISGPAYEKHRIKRADRLLSNAHLHAERVEIYTTLARRILTGTHRPIISVDWSNLDEGKRRYLLRASVAVEGRSFTLYEQVHPREQFMKAVVERRFLGVLKEIVGSERRPIVVTDAGFHNPWMRAVRALGWDFVCRVRGRVMLGDDSDNDWEQARTLFDQATHRPKPIAKTRIAFADPMACQFVILRQARCNRHHFNKSGRRVRGYYSNEQARSQREPWLLATSLDVRQSGVIKQVVRSYTCRMQIEESFRDLKSERFGLGYDASSSTRTERVEMLLLIALLTLTVAWIIGLIVQSAGLARRYQANTLIKRAVLSTVYLGRRVWRDPAYAYAQTQWWQAFDFLQEKVKLNAADW